MSIFNRKNNRSPTDVKQRGCFFMRFDDSLIPEGYIRITDNEEIKKCTHIIADLVSNMTIMLMLNGKNGDIRIKDELAKKIDVNPHKYLSRKNFIYRLVKEMIDSGNCVVYPHYNGDYLDNLSFMPGCSFIANQNGIGYNITYSSKIYNPYDVLHFLLNPSINEPFRGLGAMPFLRQTINDIAQEQNTKTGFLKSKWKPSIIVTVNSDIEDLQDKDKRSKILNSYTETTEAGEPWLIPSGEVDVKTINPLTLKDLAILEGMTFDIRKVARAFGIPPFMLGIDKFDREEYNNFISTVIMSYAQIIQQELTCKLLIAGDRYFKFNPKSLMQYSLAEKEAFVRGMVSSGMLNRNEGRNEFDYSPVDDEGMNDYIVLENYIPVSKVADQEKLKGGDENE